MLRWSRRPLLAAPSLFALVLAGCSSATGGTPGASGSGECTPAETPVISFAAYSTPREVYGKIIPAFQTLWADEHDGVKPIFQESYGASTSQAANVVAGYEADIVALSLAPDVDEIADGPMPPTRGWCPRRSSCSTCGRATRSASRTTTTSRRRASRS
jgi:sulfate transport system substrate-binding protein